MASTHQKGNEIIRRTALGCLAYFVATIAGMLAGGYGAILIAMQFAPRLLAVQIGMLVGADVLAIGVIAYFASIYSAETKRHNPALKMACAFLAIGMLVLQGNGLALVISAGLVNGLIGLGVWLWLLWPIPEPTQISN
jgi:hypothetical protein